MVLYKSIQGQGEPVILLHGLFGSADNWGVVAKALAERYQVICVDLRNHGRSPHSASHTYADMAADIVALCDQLDLSSVHVVGHSMGGKVAMQLAAQAPERVASLVVVDMALRAYPDQHTALMEAMLAVDLSSMASRSEVDNALRDTIPNTAIRQFLLMNLTRQDGRLVWRINLPSLLQNYAHLQSGITVPKAYLGPSLFIYGEYSDYVTADDQLTIKASFPQAQFLGLPTQHWVHAESPTLFIAALNSFLAARIAAR